MPVGRMGPRCEIMMDVWMFDYGDYEDYAVWGVFDSPDAAKASHSTIKNWVWEDDGWSSHDGYYRIYPMQVQTLESIQAEHAGKALAAGKRAAGDREQMRREVRAPLPYESTYIPKALTKPNKARRS